MCVVYFVSLSDESGSQGVIYHNYGDIAVCARVWIVIVGDGGGGVCI